MDKRVPNEVFTVREVARAAGVPPDAVLALVEAGAVRTVPVGGRTLYLDREEAIRAGRRLVFEASTSGLFAPVSPREPALFQPLVQAPRPQVPFAISSAAHALLVATVALATIGIGAATPDMVSVPRSDTRLVYVTVAGPGGGGGGGGARKIAPPARARTRGDRSLSSPLPARPLPTPTPRMPAASPPQVIEAPVVPVPADEDDTVGVIDEPVAPIESEGPGEDGLAGGGRDGGLGDGAGDGLGDGEGGGTGGGPYRPGAGIEPPTILHEVKPLYTEAARRRGLQGEVLLEIVVGRDGHVRDVRILRGLGEGLDARAVDAVRQWRFAPAKRYGTPVDVLVEVAMEFRLR